MTRQVKDGSELGALRELRGRLMSAAAAERSQPHHSRGKVIAGLATTAVLIVAVALGTGAGEDVPPVPKADSHEVHHLIEPRTSGAFASGGPEFASIDALVDNSPVIVAGTVAEVRSGGEIVDIDEEYPTTFVHAVVKVDSVMKGSVGDAVTVRTPELAYAPAPNGPDLEWREAGQRVVAFLAPSPNGDRLLVPTSYGQSFYRVENEAVVPLTSVTPGQDAEGVPSVPLPEFEQAVRSATVGE